MSKNKIAVIGGGSAGIMAALRCVLNNDQCLLFPGTGKDKKRSRAFWVSKVENIPGFAHYKKGIEEPNKETLKWIENSPFKENLHLFKNTSISSLKREGNVFFLEDNKGKIHEADYVILCTGVMDVQPQIGGKIEPVFPYANAQIIDYCLRCDGHHTINKNVSIIGHDSGAAWVAIMLKERYNCPEMSILTNGKDSEFSEDTQKLINKYNIKVSSGELVEIIGDTKCSPPLLEGFKLEDGTIHETNFAFVSLGMIVYNKLALDCGAAVDKRGFILTNSKGESNISNLYVAGDLRAGSKKQIYTGWDHAVDSADDINMKIRSNKRLTIS